MDMEHGHEGGHGLLFPSPVCFCKKKIVLNMRLEIVDWAGCVYVLKPENGSWRWSATYELSSATYSGVFC